MSSLCVLTSSPCETRKLIRRLWCGSCSTCCSVVTTDGEIAAGGMPWLSKNLRTVATSPRRLRAAEAAFGDSWLTRSDQRTRSELIGFRAEPVTLTVSRV